jgi:hypothetical protein
VEEKPFHRQTSTRGFELFNPLKMLGAVVCTGDEQAAQYCAFHKNCPGFTATRKVRGLTLQIEVKSSTGEKRGATPLEVDGKMIAGNFIPAAQLRDGTEIMAQIGIP